uniref:FH2 domain-containing protein n=1 Tax=Knipowitschia caucasica TaxID=637954 RepID=A0AAV2J734_KNICA
MSTQESIFQTVPPLLSSSPRDGAKLPPSASFTLQMGHPPPPPPPPPLPPPPPPPPPSFTAPQPFGSLNLRKSMKKLNWDTIPSQRVLGKKNVWTSNKSERELRLDIESMEELFSQVDMRASCRRAHTTFDIDVVKEPQVTILDSKRSMNVGIFLRHFKRPATEIVQDICQGNWLRFGSGKLKELCKLLPEDTELKQLQLFSGNVAQLPEADQFMVQLVKVPGYVQRLKSMMLREEFFPLMEEVKNSLTVLTNAANELMDCDDLHSVIRLVLKAGNYMNAGGFSANAIGFRMTSLLKLADTKANKPGMNLMHYVAKQAEIIDRDLLTFPVQLEHLKMAARMCKEEVVAEFEREVKKIKEVKLYASRQPDLFEQENRAREAAEERRKTQESMRQSIRRRPTSSCPQTILNHEPDPSGLESVLQTFLSNVPGSVSRPKRSLHPRSASRSQSVKAKSSPQTSLKDKQSLLSEGSNCKTCKNNENTRETKRKVLQRQNGMHSLDEAAGTPRRTKEHSCAPKTPKNNEYFHDNRESGGSPWTILSPMKNPPRNTADPKKQISHDPDDCIWESVEVTLVPDSTFEESLTASISSTPVNIKSISHGPLHRSVSVDEARKSAFWFGDFFQKSFSQRSYSSGSRSDALKDEGAGKATRPFENQAIKSFFKRIGSRNNKLGETEEPSIVKSCC